MSPTTYTLEEVTKKFVCMLFNLLNVFQKLNMKEKFERSIY